VEGNSKPEQPDFPSASVAKGPLSLVASRGAKKERPKRVDESSWQATKVKNGPACKDHLSGKEFGMVQVKML